LSRAIMWHRDNTPHDNAPLARIVSDRTWQKSDNAPFGALSCYTTHMCSKSGTMFSSCNTRSEENIKNILSFSYFRIILLTTAIKYTCVALYISALGCLLDTV
jgi:hypothetical protein